VTRCGISSSSYSNDLWRLLCNGDFGVRFGLQQPIREDPMVTTTGMPATDTQSSLVDDRPYIPLDSTSDADADAVWRSVGRYSGTCNRLDEGRIAADRQCHLDPDLDANCLGRQPNCRMALGEVWTAQSRLSNNGVGRGDIFRFGGLLVEGVTISAYAKQVQDHPPEDGSDAAPPLGIHHLSDNERLKMAAVAFMCFGVTKPTPWQWQAAHEHLFTPVFDRTANCH
jgi:hypothetical protein